MQMKMKHIALLMWLGVLVLLGGSVAAGVFVTAAPKKPDILEDDIDQFISGLSARHDPVGPVRMNYSFMLEPVEAPAPVEVTPQGPNVAEIKKELEKYLWVEGVITGAIDGAMVKEGEPARAIRPTDQDKPVLRVVGDTTRFGAVMKEITDSAVIFEWKGVEVPMEPRHKKLPIIIKREGDDTGEQPGEVRRPSRQLKELPEFDVRDFYDEFPDRDK
jgi:hypothetical protein